MFDMERAYQQADQCCQQQRFCSGLGRQGRRGEAACAQLRQPGQPHAGDEDGRQQHHAGQRGEQQRRRIRGGRGPCVREQVQIGEQHGGEQSGHAAPQQIVGLRTEQAVCTAAESQRVEQKAESGYRQHAEQGRQPDVARDRQRRFPFLSGEGEGQRRQEQQRDGEDDESVVHRCASVTTGCHSPSRKPCNG
ncbi:MAG TPA: hypothetical protein DCK83_01260 [Gallionellaceae bacterium]|nr:hypothetical protein [Gallionellaceae bacterium]